MVSVILIALCLSRLLVLEGSELPFVDDYRTWGLLGGLKALDIHKWRFKSYDTVISGDFFVHCSIWRDLL